MADNFSYFMTKDIPNPDLHQLLQQAAQDPRGMALVGSEECNIEKLLDRIDVGERKLGTNPLYLALNRSFNAQNDLQLTTEEFENNKKRDVKLLLARGINEKDSSTYFTLSEWLQEPNNNFDFDYLNQDILPLFTEGNSAHVMRDWLKKDGNNLDFETFKQNLALFENITYPGYLHNYCSIWLQKPDNILDVRFIDEIFPKIIDPSNDYTHGDKSGLIEEYVNLPNNNLDVEIFKKTLPFVKKNKKVKVAEICLTKEENGLSYFKEILPLFDSFKDQEALSLTYLKKPNNLFDHSFIEEVLPILEKTADFKIEGFLLSVSGTNAHYSSFVAKDSKITIEFSSLKEALSFMPYPSSNGHYYQNQFLDSWLSQHKTQITPDSLKEIVSLFDDRPINKKFLAEKFLLKSENDIRPHLKEVLPLFNDFRDRRSLAEGYFNKPGSSFDSDFITGFLPLLIEQNNATTLPRFLHNILLSKTKFESASLKETLPLMNQEDRASFVNVWADKHGDEFELNILKEVLPFLNDDQEKHDCIAAWLNITPDLEDKYQNFVAAAKENIFDSLYQTPSIAYFYHGYFTDENKAEPKEIIRLCKDLYPANEFYQTELFCNFIDYSHLKAEDKIFVKSFIASLDCDDETIKVLEHINSGYYEIIELTELETLEIASQRFSSKPTSIRDLLNIQDLEESLTPEGLNSVRSLFDSDENNNHLSGKKLTDLFSYYEIKNDLKSFNEILKPDVLEKIRNSYTPSDKSPYVSREEFEKLENLLNGESLPELDFLPVMDLAVYLKSHVPKIPKITGKPEAKEYEFGQSVILEEREEGASSSQDTESKRDKVTNLFRRLLENKENSWYDVESSAKNDVESSLNETTTKDVVEFFKEALSLKDEIDPITKEVLPAIKPENEDKLASFFLGNSDELAFLFQQENGLGEFVNTISTLGDGCVANIATHARISLYKSIIQEPYAQVLYGIFVEKISTPILNSNPGIDNLGGENTGVDILDTQTSDTPINQCLISPNGLVKALVETFYLDDETLRNPVDLALNNHIVSHEILENINNEGMTQLVVQDILRKSLPAKDAIPATERSDEKKATPAILNSRFLQGFNHSCREIIEKAEEKVREMREGEDMYAEDFPTIKIDAEKFAQADAQKKIFAERRLAQIEKRAEEDANIKPGTSVTTPESGNLAKPSSNLQVKSF